MNTFKNLAKHIGNRHVLTKAKICEILGLPMIGKNETYTKLGFAHDVIAGGVAIVSVNTADPKTVTSTARCIELADLAMNRGAKLLLSTFQIKDYPCLIVENVVDAFCKIATDIRMQYNPKTVAITGSIGKTTTTQMVYAVLSAKYNTHRNDSSANNVRLAAEVLQRLKPEHEVYVQETMEGPPYGAASTISKMILPHAAIVTVVGTSHMAEFGSQERILESCLGVQDGMAEDGLLILNGDDVFQWNAKTKRKAVYYAIDNKKADYYAENIRGEGSWLAFDVIYDNECVPVRIRCFGKHNVLNALAAFAVGKWAGMRNEEIVLGLSNYRTVGIRQNFVRYGGKRLYLDCYNAAPESMQSAFDALNMIEVPYGGRRLAVLADIAEVGEKEREFHLAVGEMVSKSCIEGLICYGKKARLIASVVLQKSRMPVYCTDNQDELVQYLKTTITNKDVVLFKGSHSMALEHAVDRAFGTWFHEEYDQYEFRTKIVSDANLKYRIHRDHAVVIEKISNVEDVVIPNNIENIPVTGIEKNALYGSKYTKSLILPNNLVSIRYCSFYNITKIEEVIIPASVRIIDRSAFNQCTNLKNVIIESGCTHIGYRAFANCSKLAAIYVPATVVYIDDEVFFNCPNLTIYGESGSPIERYAQMNNIPFNITSDNTVN